MVPRCWPISFAPSPVAPATGPWPISATARSPASARSLDALTGVTDPEVKRKMIGKLFVDVFDAEAEKLGEIDFLAQGTLYPDVIESVSATGGPAATIKAHHNVGGRPAPMRA